MENEYVFRSKELGMTLQMHLGEVTVMALVNKKKNKKGSAEKLGIAVGDTVVAVNGQAVSGKFDDIITMIKEAPRPLHLRIAHNSGDDPMIITRAKRKAQSERAKRKAQAVDAMTTPPRKKAKTTAPATPKKRKAQGEGPSPKAPKKAPKKTPKKAPKEWNHNTHYGLSFEAAMRDGIRETANEFGWSFRCTQLNHRELYFHTKNDKKLLAAGDIDGYLKVESPVTLKEVLPEGTELCMGGVHDKNLVLEKGTLVIYEAKTSWGPSIDRGVIHRKERCFQLFWHRSQRPPVIVIFVFGGVAPTTTMWQNGRLQDHQCTFLTPQNTVFAWTKTQSVYTWQADVSVRRHLGKIKHHPKYPPLYILLCALVALGLCFLLLFALALTDSLPHRDLRRCFSIYLPLAARCFTRELLLGLLEPLPLES